jgi:hypothetical protein
MVVCADQDKHSLLIYLNVEMNYNNLHPCPILKFSSLQNYVLPLETQHMLEWWLDFMMHEWLHCWIKNVQWLNLGVKKVCRLWLCFSSMQLLMHEVKGIPWENLCIVLFCLQMYHVLKSFFHVRSLISALSQILYLPCWCTKAWGLYFFNLVVVTTITKFFLKDGNVLRM